MDESALDYLVDMAAIDDHAGGIAKAHLAEYGLKDLFSVAIREKRPGDLQTAVPVGDTDAVAAQGVPLM